MDQSFNMLDLRDFTEVTLFCRQDYYLNGIKFGNRRHFQANERDT